MQWKIPILAAIALLTILPAVPFTTRVNAVVGQSVDAPGNQWAPYGPFADRLQFNFYSDETVEFNEFELGNLDLTDWAVPKTSYAAYDGQADFVLSPGQGEFGMFIIDFNNAASTWTNWGCNFDFGRAACATQIKQALSHLIDRPRWVVDGPLGGAGEALADPSPPAKSPDKSPLSTQQAWDMLHPGALNAYNLAPDAGGFPLAGSQDFCAAADHMLAAGIGVTAVGGACLGNAAYHLVPTAAMLASPVRMMVRSDDPRRNNLGTGLHNTFRALFGAAAVTAPSFGTIAQLGDIVFVTEPLGAMDDWDTYTGGWGLGGPFPDHLYPLYNSVFASDVCTGNPADLNGEPLNYGFYCLTNPGTTGGSFDDWSLAALQTDVPATFIDVTLKAFDEWGQHVGNIPVYSRGSRFVALRDMAGIVNQRGFGYTNFWSILNGRNDPAYAPAPLYTFGGGSNTLRWGQRQPLTHLNVFTASTVWEFNVIGAIYEGLYLTSPVSPATIINWMAAKTDTDFPIGPDGLEDTRFTITLKQGLKWHDGTDVTADDVAFTFLNYRDVPASVLAAQVQLVVSATALNARTVVVVMDGRSLSHQLNLAGAPIIPKHLWDTNNDGIADADKVGGGVNTDPFSTSRLIGSGPFMCRRLPAFGTPIIGSGCARTGGGQESPQAIPIGGSMLLERFDRTAELGATVQYHRSLDEFSAFSKADFVNDARVDVVDLSAFGQCIGTAPTPDPTNCPATTFDHYDMLAPPPGLVLRSDVVLLSGRVMVDFFDDTWVNPFSWTQQDLVNIVPFTP